MQAGAIGILDEPASEPLESWTRNGGLPALDVRDTQPDLDGNSTVQSGVAGGTVTAPETDVEVADNGKIITSSHDARETVHTSWVADVTGAGIVVAESVQGGGEFPFPFDLFYSRVGQPVERVAIDLETIADAWSEDGLQETWMVGRGDHNGASIDYNASAHTSDARRASIGLGFELAWQGQVAKGVLYASGYLAVWEPWTASVFCRFVEEELLPHAYVPEDDDDGPGEQSTLGGED